jgi:hypothetical protein
MMQGNSQVKGQTSAFLSARSVREGLLLAAVSTGECNKPDIYISGGAFPALL